MDRPCRSKLWALKLMENYRRRLQVMKACTINYFSIGISSSDAATFGLGAMQVKIYTRSRIIDIAFIPQALSRLVGERGCPVSKEIV
ncbi:hypothetical protein JHK86_006536 [Glycine max]|nr:hypothetical protein JHK86_006536 [Glycine max]